MMATTNAQRQALFTERLRRTGRAHDIKTRITQKLLQRAGEKNIVFDDQESSGPREVRYTAERH
jgi:hypothetical protein